jgi:hypothetical protein
MSEEFNNVIAEMRPLLDRLLATAPASRDQLRGIPERGIYVFYEKDQPIYVGRSNRLKQRLLEHGRPSSRHNSATFAFNLAMEAASQGQIPLPSGTRAEIENGPRFSHLYNQAKARVAAMKVRVVEVKNPIEQTIFEVYAALALGTAYNDFDTH